MPPSTSDRPPSSSSSEQTRTKLVTAAREVLQHHGYAAATARTIAETAGRNQALVFY